MTARAIAWRSGILAACLAATVVPAAAQGTGGSRPIEVAGGIVWSGGVSFGTADANLLTPSGGNLALFHTSSRLTAGIGFDLRVAVRAAQHLWVEATGGFRHAQLETTTSGDFEGAAAATLTESTSRFTLQGGAVWCFAHAGRTEPFVRGSAGWTRDLSSDGAFAVNGFVASAGAGVKYWLHESAGGALRRVGIRVDAAAVVRRGGISLNSRTTFLSPSLAGSIILGW